MTPLRVQVFTGAYSSIAVHIADELGFFEKQNLKVAKVPANSSSAAIAAMLGDSIDIVESAADLVLANIDKGTDIKYLMSNESKNFATLVVSTKLSLPNESKGYPAVMQDLKGQRLGVNAIGATLHLAATMMLDDAGMKKGEVEFVATGTAATTMAAWRSGSVDAQLTFAPVPEILSALGVARTLFVTADQGPDVMRFTGLYAGWVAKGDFIKNNKAAADGFIRAMTQAIDWIVNPANNEKLVQFAKKYSPVSMLSEAENEKVLENMVKNYRRFWGYQISRDAIEQWNDYSLRNNLIKRRVPYEKVVYEGAPTCTTSCM
jgi:NitT/TauT family transport system substrate-binding protein